jgi:ATP-dependent Zn protease
MSGSRQASAASNSPRRPGGSGARPRSRSARTARTSSANTATAIRASASDVRRAGCHVGGLSGGQDEREQTLNQILAEMDGFAPQDNVFVLGATNRSEVLDPALLRPGRIGVQPPDKPGRVTILEIHTRWVPLNRSVDLEQVAASTPGMTGADLVLLIDADTSECVRAC